MVLIAHCHIVTPVGSIYPTEGAAEGRHSCKEKKHSQSTCRGAEIPILTYMSQKPASVSLFYPTVIFFQWTEIHVL